jgi:hypothetical protein
LALAGDSTITTFIQEVSFGGPRRAALGRSGAGYGDAEAGCQIQQMESVGRSGRALPLRPEFETRAVCFWLYA